MSGEQATKLFLIAVDLLKVVRTAAPEFQALAELIHARQSAGEDLTDADLDALAERARLAIGGTR